MSPDDSADPGDAPVPLRAQFSAELSQLRLQVELMGIRVDENLERMREVLDGAPATVVDAALAADDEIDGMNVSLTERCYDVLARETPVASDLRLVVSVIRMTGELERVGDLALRVIKLQPEVEQLRVHERAFDILRVMGDGAVDRFREALRAWAAHDLDLAAELASQRSPLGYQGERLLEAVLGLTGPDAVPCAIRFLIAGQAVDRIADHAVVIGARVRYLLTGDPVHLAAEVR